MGYFTGLEDRGPINGNGLSLAGAGGHLIKFVNLCNSISI